MKKLRIVFFSTPAYGHMNCAMPVIKRLSDRGHSIIICGTPKFKNMIESTGAKYSEYPVDLDSKLDLEKATSNFYELFRTLSNLNKRMYLYYLTKTAHLAPDIILYDSMCGFAKDIGAKLKIKHICLCTTMAYNNFVFAFSNMLPSTIKLIGQQGHGFYNVIKNDFLFRKRYGIKRRSQVDMFVNSGDKTIVFTPPQLQPFVHTFPKTFYFVGTTIGDRIKQSAAEYDDYDIYAAFGTIFGRNDMLQKIVSSGALDNGKMIVLSKAARTDSPNITYAEHTEQLALLPHVKLFINHGGLNSVYESIWFGVPQLCIPMQEEQKMTSIIAERKGLSVYLKSVDEDSIRKAVAKAKSLSNNIKHFSGIMRSYDGTALAVRIIEDE